MLLEKAKRKTISVSSGIPGGDGDRVTVDFTKNQKGRSGRGTTKDSHSKCEKGTTS